MKAEIGWKGSGTELDPIIINDLSNLKPYIWIHLSSLHYVIRDVTIFKLMCINTQNITIEHCKIHELEIQGCYNISVRNSTILHLRFGYSKRCALENNSFSNESLHRLEINFLDVFYPKLQAGMNTIAVIFVVLATTVLLYNLYLWFITLLMYGLVALILYYVHTLKSKHKRTLNQPENILTDNRALSMGEWQTIYREILDNYIYLKFSWFRGFLHIWLGIPCGVTVGIVLAIIFIL